MAWIKLDPMTREVIQKSCSPDAGFIEAPDYVTCGMFEQADGTYLAPTVQKTYQELRAASYPPISEQLDMIYWDGVNGTTAWKDHITSIKTQYPKV